MTVRDTGRPGISGIALGSSHTHRTWAVWRLAGKAQDLLAKVFPLLLSQVAVAGQEAAGLKVAAGQLRGRRERRAGPSAGWLGDSGRARAGRGQQHGGQHRGAGLLKVITMPPESPHWAFMLQ